MPSWLVIGKQEARSDPLAGGIDGQGSSERVLKDAELFMLGEESAAGENGFADVWKKGCFAWEYKGRKKNLDLAYRQ